MTPLLLLENLTALWLAFDGENADKKPVVNRYNVLEIAKEYYKKSDANLFTFVDSVLFDKGLSCPVEHTICLPCVVDSLKAMDEFSTKKGHLPVSAFVHMFEKNNINELYYFELTEIVATALDIDISEEEVSNDFWQQAYNDELSPLEAVLSAQKVHNFDAADNVLDYLAQVPQDVAKKHLDQITGRDVDMDTDFNEEVILCLSKWNDDKFTSFYNELLTKNIRII
jgi:hypothetical protein